MKDEHWAIGGSPPVEALISVGIGMAILSLVITAIMNMFNLAVRKQGYGQAFRDALTRMGGVLTRIEEILKKGERERCLKIVWSD